MSRPELRAPPQLIYDELESKKYSSNSHICEVQQKITERCIELLNLDSPNKLLLDIGCGSGLSGEVLSDFGHNWIGVDISRPMLNVALERGIEGDLFQWDMGQGITFRPGSFDGAISVSALQWLFNADSKAHNPFARIRHFFETLSRCIVRGGRAVFQAYPSDKYQMDILANSAAKAGFGGGWLVDYPNSTRAKKYYLVLFSGIPKAAVPQALSSEVESVRCESRKSIKNRRGPKKLIKGTRAWILAKKERQRRQGKDVRPDSRYTGRRRRPIH